MAVAGHDLVTELTEGLRLGDKHQVLLGATGTGKTFSVAHMIAQYGRPTLVMSRDLYATPILFGVSVQILLLNYAGFDGSSAALVGGGLIFACRAAAIHFHLQMPDILTTGIRDTGQRP